MANNPFTILSNINVTLSVKEEQDGGIVNVTGGSSGTFVAFNKDFVDVRSIVVSARKNASYDVEALWEFGTEEDGGFTAYVLRRDNGSYVDGEVSWQVRGVV
jgi:hypothetical protein